MYSWWLTQAVAELIEKCLKRRPRLRPSAREICDILKAMPHGSGPAEPYEHPEAEIEGQQPAMIEEDDAEGEGEELEEVGVLGNGGGPFEDEILESVPMSISDGSHMSTGGILESREGGGQALLISTGFDDRHMQPATPPGPHTQTPAQPAAHMQSPTTGPFQHEARVQPLTQAVPESMAHAQYHNSPFAAHNQSHMASGTAPGAA